MGREVRSRTEDEAFQVFQRRDGLLLHIICKVSTRFKRLATDYSFWQGKVEFINPSDPRKIEFVVQQCLNQGTREFFLCYEGENMCDLLYDLLTCPRYAEFINPTKKFPNLILTRPIQHDCLYWTDPPALIDDSGQSSDENESLQ